MARIGTTKLRASSFGGFRAGSRNPPFFFALILCRPKEFAPPAAGESHGCFSFRALLAVPGVGGGNSRRPRGHLSRAREPRHRPWRESPQSTAGQGRPLGDDPTRGPYLSVRLDLTGGRRPEDGPRSGKSTGLCAPQL